LIPGATTTAGGIFADKLKGRQKAQETQKSGAMME
jgi:hypothetical protein